MAGKTFNNAIYSIVYLWETKQATVKPPLFEHQYAISSQLSKKHDSVNPLQYSDQCCTWSQNILIKQLVLLFG